MKNKQLRDRVDKLDTNWIFSEIASGIDLASAPTETLTRGEQWKVWLQLGEKTDLDLIAELSNASGRPKTGDPISDVPVPFYEPGPVQWEAHQSTERVVLVAGGWRAGKSKWLAAQLLPYMFKSYAHIWIVANDYHLAREEFNYIQMWLDWFKVPLSKDASKPKEGQWQLITAWGATMETMTGKDEDKIEMDSLNACGIAEAGQTEASLLGKVRGRVFQKRGKIFISGSLVAAQPWYVNALKRYKNGSEDDGWHSYSIPSYDNLAVFPAGANDPEIGHMKRSMTPEEFARKVLAEPVAPEGLVFGEFSDDIHVVPMKYVDMDEDEIVRAMRIVHSPFGAASGVLVPKEIKDAGGFKTIGWDIPVSFPLELAIDPGYDPGRYAVLVIARWQNMCLVVDEIYETQKTGEEVIQICKDQDWWPRVVSGVIDVASKQHQMGMSEHEKWRKYGGLQLRTQAVPIPDGIARYRTFLKSPENGLSRMYVTPQCENFIWEHSNYRYPKHKEDRRIQETPVDANNHAIKAFTYYLIVRFGFVDRTGGTTHKKYIDRQPIRQRSGSDDWRAETDTWEQ